MRLRMLLLLLCCSLQVLYLATKHRLDAGTRESGLSSVFGRPAAKQNELPLYAGQSRLFDALQVAANSLIFRLVFVQQLPRAAAAFIYTLN